MIFEVKNRIIARDATDELRDYCKTALTLANPEFYKAERAGRSTWRIPRNLVLYETVGNDIYIPFGKLQDLYNRFGGRYEFRNGVQLTTGAFIAYNWDADAILRSYQITAVNEAIKARNGVIIMPCGAGKTQTALAIIAKLGLRALWLTHTQDLLNQSKDRALSVFGIDKKAIGTITGGKINVGAALTFATVQTMRKIDFSSYADYWDCVIVDECHKAVGTPTKVMQFYDVLSKLRARYKFGITATAERKDGLHVSMYALLGGKICEISKEVTAAYTCPVAVETVETDYEPNYDVALNFDGTLNYTALVSDMCANEERFELVSNKINSLRGVLVLANRVEYLQRLNEAYAGKSVCLSKLGTSKAAKAARKQALKDLNTGELDAVFATYQLAKEGLDVPALRYVVFATPEKDETTVIQSVGRVARKCEGKERGVVIDIVDKWGMFKSWRKKRERCYRKCDAEY